jgi:uncharacterized membrane protein
MAHIHDLTGRPEKPVSQRVRLLLAAAIVPLLIATAIGFLILRPRGRVPDVDDRLGFPAELVNGTVVGKEGTTCPGTPEDAGVRCEVLEIELTSGSEEGETILLDWAGGGGSPDIDTGDRIVLGHERDIPAGAPPEVAYYFADFQRRTPMLWLSVIFAVAVVALGRLRGLRALVALGLSLVVLVRFVLPSILEGHSPVAVAIVGSAMILVLALYLSHGINVRTTTAVLGTLVSLAVTAVLAVVFVAATQLTGLASEEATYLRAFAEHVDIQGLLLGGIIIGSLGVLDDVTVTQASAVWELHQANPALGLGRLYASAVRIGRDHIASTVNTLVLAYAGASLPLLILFTQSQRELGDVLTGELVAVEVVRTLVGSIGLVASVPVTTALTALVVTADRDGPAMEGPESGPTPS